MGTITDTEDTEETFKLFGISPNPTQGTARIELQGFSGDYRLELVALTGQLLQSDNLKLTENEYRIHTVSLADFPTGMYYVRLTGADRVWTKALVKE